VGSNSNITENGMGAEMNRAAIWEAERETGRWRIFASGPRNPNGLTFEPETGALWTVVNERDELGPNLVPDYMTSVKDGGFYGWPYSYWGRHLDPRVEPQRPDLVGAPMSPLWGSPSTRQTAFPRSTAAVPSSASMAAGIATSSMAIRSSSYRSAAGAQTGRPRMSSRDSSCRHRVRID
jgi:hypothetical protein